MTLRQRPTNDPGSVAHDGPDPLLSLGDDEGFILGKVDSFPRGVTGPSPGRHRSSRHSSAVYYCPQELFFRLQISCCLPNFVRVGGRLLSVSPFDVAGPVGSMPFLRSRLHAESLRAPNSCSGMATPPESSGKLLHLSSRSSVLQSRPVRSCLILYPVSRLHVFSPRS